MLQSHGQSRSEGRCENIYGLLCDIIRHILSDKHGIVEWVESMYNSVLEAHERFKTLEKDLKNLSKESQVMVKEKDAAEKRKTEAMKKHAKVELDVRDFEEKINGEGRMKVCQ